MKFLVFVALAVQLMISTSSLWFAVSAPSGTPYPAGFVAIVTAWTILSLAGFAAWVRDHAC
jgi:hypothetical protein